MTFPCAKLLLFLSFVVSLCTLVVALNPAVDADEAALLDFKSFITSDPSGILSEWEPAVRNHCEWQGVTCNTTSGRVIRLELTGTLDSPLAGILSANLGNLTELRILVLRQNSFYGEIPAAAIGRLRLLETFDLSGNNFSGRIPDDIAKLPSLSILDLARNFFDGPIPIGLIGHAPLKYVDLSFNRLSDGININPLGDCTSLNHLKLSSNLLAGEIPHDIGKCSNLRALLLDNNTLQGSIPADLGKIAELRILDVSKNSLTGRIPEELGDCRQLVALVLTNLIGSSIADSSSPSASSTTEEFNAFVGAIPAKVLSLPNLEILWAPRANLGGGLHDLFNPSCTLKILNLGQNYFNGSIPELLGSCVNLTYLDLSLNNLQGSIPVSLGVQCMAYFNVSRNLLSGPLIGSSGKSCTASFFPVHLSWGLLKLEDDLLTNYYANLLQIAQENNPFGKVPGEIYLFSMT
ncbi:hypothetical protein HPP92_008241 [Vanilla planifolia]|uniref:Leucine-rich repeat-containing N-terminal plant-type domain-containing protein n=1 Tax=Vanilla planifolia TaxID=51239 RepID=A0A835VA55_VANPL|nr:hypothetical protein HPP92_008241 [Vanilla planifolia]